MKYAILKSLSGTYYMSLHQVSNDLESITIICENLNKNLKGIVYYVKELSDYQ